MAPLLAIDLPDYQGQRDPFADDLCEQLDRLAPIAIPGDSELQPGSAAVWASAAGMRALATRLAALR